MKPKLLALIITTVSLMVFSFFIFYGCDTGGISVPGSLYMTDTFNGRVYTFDIASQTASSTPSFTTGEGAGDRIYFFNDIGYIAVGSSGTNNPGVYRFDPTAMVPVAERIGSRISAQYIAFYSSTKAYVTDADFFSSTGVYTFNPSDPDAGLSSSPIQGTDDFAGGMFLQDIVIANGTVYVADNGNGQVLIIDPETDTLESTSPIATSAQGTTGLLTVGTDVYVANNGGFDLSFNPLPGSVDVIDTTTDTLRSLLSGISIDQMVYHSGSGSFYATGFGNTYTFDTSGTVTELKNSSDQSFGGTDIIIVDQYIYIAVTDYTTSRLYIFDAATGSELSISPVSIMVDGEDAVTGLAAY